MDELCCVLDCVLVELGADGSLLMLGVWVDEFFCAHYMWEFFFNLERIDYDGPGATFILEELVILFECSNLLVYKIWFIGCVDYFFMILEAMEIGYCFIIVHGLSGIGKICLVVEVGCRCVEKLCVVGGTWICDLEVV